MTTCTKKYALCRHEAWLPFQWVKQWWTPPLFCLADRQKAIAKPRTLRAPIGRSLRVTMWDSGLSESAVVELKHDLARGSARSCRKWSTGPFLFRHSPPKPLQDVGGADQGVAAAPSGFRFPSSAKSFRARSKEPV